MNILRFIVAVIVVPQLSIPLVNVFWSGLTLIGVFFRPVSPEFPFLVWALASVSMAVIAGANCWLVRDAWSRIKIHFS